MPFDILTPLQPTDAPIPMVDGSTFSLGFAPIAVQAAPYTDANGGTLLATQTVDGRLQLDYTAQDGTVTTSTVDFPEGYSLNRGLDPEQLSPDAGVGVPFGATLDQFAMPLFTGTIYEAYDALGTTSFGVGVVTLDDAGVPTLSYTDTTTFQSPGITDALSASFYPLGDGRLGFDIGFFDANHNGADAGGVLEETAIGAGLIPLVFVQAGDSGLVARFIPLDDGGVLGFYATGDQSTYDVVQFDADGMAVAEQSDILTFAQLNGIGAEEALAVVDANGDIVFYTQGSDGQTYALVADLLPTSGMDVIGTPDDDMLIGTQLADVIDGAEGDDKIVGGAGNDVLTGGAGNDQLFGGQAADLIHGGDGDDLLIGGYGHDSLFGDAGRDILLGNGGADYLDGGDGNDLINGGQGQDLIFGGSGDDILLGGGGADSIVGDGGDDLINGGTGDDSIAGGFGDDVIRGAAGDDWIEGNDGNDLMIAGDGSDELYGGEGDDTLYGGDGNDFLSGGAGNDLLVDLSGDQDYLDGGGGDNTIINGDGDSVIFAEDGNNTVFAGGGNDFILSQYANNQITGGEGADTFGFYSADPVASDPVYVSTITDFTQGSDTVVLGVAGDLLGRPATFDDLFLSQEDSTAVIEFGDQQIRMENMDVEDLSEADILFDIY